MRPVKVPVPFPDIVFLGTTQIIKAGHPERAESCRRRYQQHRNVFGQEMRSGGYPSRDSREIQDCIAQIVRPLSLVDIEMPVRTINVRWRTDLPSPAPDHLTPLVRARVRGGARPRIGMDLAGCRPFPVLGN